MESFVQNIEKRTAKVSRYALENRLTVSIEKTRILPFGCYADSIPNFTNISFKIGNTEKNIKRVKQAKYLGVIFDSYMRWNGHVDLITAKLRKFPYSFGQMREFLIDKQLIQVYLLGVGIERMY